MKDLVTEVPDEPMTFDTTPKATTPKATTTAVASAEPTSLEVTPAEKELTVKRNAAALAAADFAAAPSVITVQNCEEESIRVPGSIQRHGFLLLLDEANERVVAASENTEEFLGVPLKLILGTPVETILPREILIAVRALSTLDEPTGLLTYLGSFTMRGELYSVITHRVKNERVIEFEQLDRLVSPELMNAVITNFVGKLSKLTTQIELCTLITKQVRDLTGFNRILLYSFDDVGHGTVLVEDNDGLLPTCLDLRFPASDIPQQARELYIANTVRIIPNADYAPSPLQGIPGRRVASLDLSTSLLRSVSPIHLEYMRNMGTVSSMSISIVCDGKLWGLISGHHATPHRVPYLVRSACDLLTKMVGTQLTAFRTTSKLARMVHFHSVHRRALTLMAAEKDYIAAMAEQIDYLMEVTGAEGVALVVGDQCELGGKTPNEALVMKLARWMDERPDMKLFETNQSRRDIKWDEEIGQEASGLLIIRISDVRSSYLMWFRPEVERTVKWAGQPGKQVDGTGILRPRNSFGMWKELVRGQSTPWTDVEIESAREFRSAVMTISLKRAEEAAELSEARFKQLTHALPNLVWTADDDGQLTYVNQKWRDEGLRDHGRWWDQGQLNEEDRLRSRELWQQAILDNAPFEAELLFQRENEVMGRWNLVRAIPFLRVNQSRAGWVGTCTDLTDRRERELAVRMTEKLALTGRMTSVIAHEINNPLEAITNLLYLLGSEVPDHGPARDYIGMAESELERISGITKQTLRWSRESVQPRVIGTAGVIFEEVKRLFSGKIRNRQVEVTIVGGEDITYFGVVGQVRQVIANLISNAVDAVPVGGKVWLEAVSPSADGTPAGEFMEIIVGDAGPGMSDDVRRQLFQPFYSTKGDLGNGLGLYISKEIVDRLKGHLLLESTVGVGTVVRVRLPVKQE